MSMYSLLDNSKLIFVSRNIFKERVHFVHYSDIKCYRQTKQTSVSVR